MSKPETLNLNFSGKGTGHGEVKGTMAFDRNDCGMISGIPFIKIAERVEVTVDFKVDRVSRPPLVFKLLFKRDFELRPSRRSVLSMSPSENSPG